MTLRTLFAMYPTDKDRHHSYGRIYEPLLDPIRHNARSILEIGVQTGASLLVWRDYFCHADIHGIDNDEDCTIPDDPRIEVHLGDQSDAHFVEIVGRSFGPFDFICDDGSHRLGDQLVSYHCLNPYLRPGGIYVIEDVQSTYAGQIFERLGAIVYHPPWSDSPKDDRLAVFGSHLFVRPPEQGSSESSKGPW